MKQTKKISIIAILSLAVIVGGLFFSLTKQTKADLSGPGIQIRGGDSEDPCKNSEDSDAATNEACSDSGGGGGGGGSTPKPEYPIITTQMAVDSVTVFVLNQSGYIKSQKSSCVIEDGKNNCNVLFDWETFSPVGTSSVTRNPEAGFTIQNANTGTGVSLPVYYGTSRYFLYNNSQKLDETSVDASCATGSS